VEVVARFPNPYTGNIGAYRHFCYTEAYKFSSIGTLSGYDKHAYVSLFHCKTDLERG
jgi:hypothetical protein